MISSTPFARLWAHSKLMQPSQLSSYGWSWVDDRSVDANFLDLALLIARNSTCKDGHMGCVIARGVEVGEGDEPGGSIDGLSKVVLCTINSSIFGDYRSDCHAEANAVSLCAANGVAMRGLSCYVTRNPCTSCYKLLAASGIRRIIYPNSHTSEDCAASALALGIEMRSLADSPERRAWRDTLGRENEDMERVVAHREEKKRLKKQGLYGKKTIREQEGSVHDHESH
mmetsp:Transcript_1491/g.3088  ORF Transcript_1491/g.3088 Transcript_1491/m.3088 type:complete len:227 (+) Transcript_1491:276-956(+)